MDDEKRSRKRRGLRKAPWKRTCACTLINENRKVKILRGSEKRRERNNARKRRKNGPIRRRRLKCMKE